MQTSTVIGELEGQPVELTRRQVMEEGPRRERPALALREADCCCHRDGVGNQRVHCASALASRGVNTKYDEEQENAKAADLQQVSQLIRSRRAVWRKDTDRLFGAPADRERPRRGRRDSSGRR